MNYKNVSIIYEDNHILVVNKPNGLLSQKDSTDDDSIIEVLKDYIKSRYDKPGNVFMGSVHRIDRPASGMLVFAKTSKALTRLSESMKKGEFSKKYYAIVEGVIELESGTLNHYLIKDIKTNTVKVFNKMVGESKYSILNYKKLAIVNNLTLLDIELITGRPHQIRAQLSHVFFPILGDFKYGSSYKSEKHSIYLHSNKLSFPHPTLKNVMEFEYKPDLENPVWAQFKKYIG